MNPSSFQVSQFKSQKSKVKSQKVFLLLLLSITVLLLSSCASSKKFTGEDKTSSKPDSDQKPPSDHKPDPGFNFEKTVTSIPVRVLVNEDLTTLSFTAESSLRILNDENPVAEVKKGDNITLTNETGSLALNINGQSFHSSRFNIKVAEGEEYFFFNGKKYRGAILVNSNGKIVNVIQLEDYLKGVLPAEMPLGKENENFEALKAFAICARTYTMIKLGENKPDFDLYIDVRDQVYGGADREKEISNRAIKETEGKTINYGGEPAPLFYHASCGGYTEEGGNVFSGGNKPYLTMIKDGDEPYCSIAPKFEWEETYTEKEFINRLVKAGLTEPGSSLKALEISSRFASGRVNELKIETLSNSGEIKEVKIFGNQIRSIIRTSDDKGILRSTMFDVSFDGSNVVIKGKGYGHGVGLCQWGAIAQSRQGKNYEEILEHYFPGTKIERLERLKD